ncbi:FMN-dependent dehydrogenase [Aspergillus unguis]
MANRPASLDPNVHTIDDLKRLGSAQLPLMYREYYNEGSMDLLTLAENETAFNRYKIRPRALVNVAEVDTRSEIFGTGVSFPLGLSPSAMHKLAHPDGEVATSQAAANAGVAMALSSYSTCSLEDVASQGAAAGNPYAIQMCVLKDRSITIQLLRRAEAAGYKALFLSVDNAVLGKRLNEYRNSFALPDDMSWPNILSHSSDTSEGVSYDASLDWETTIPWLREHTTLQIWLKGVNRPDDIELAIKHGVDGVVVSNHGGRQLDGMPATIDILRECAPIARGRIPLAIDGGIRRGSDIFKALALGATHCFVGRAAIWGLAYNGAKGVELGLKILLQELRITMALAGCPSIKDIDSSYLSVLRDDGVLAKL